MLALCLLVGALCVVAILKAHSMEVEEEPVEPPYRDWLWPKKWEDA